MSTSPSLIKDNKVRNILMSYVVTGIVVGTEYLLYQSLLIFFVENSELYDLATIFSGLFVAIVTSLLVIFIWPFFWIYGLLDSNAIFPLDRISLVTDVIPILELLSGLILLSPILAFLVFGIVTFLSVMKKFNIIEEESVEITQFRKGEINNRYQQILETKQQEIHSDKEVLVLIAKEMDEVLKKAFEIDKKNKKCFIQ
jgi:hypothetical protein